MSTKSSITTYSGQVSPPPANRTTTPCTFTKQQKAFIGPHHCTKISRQKQQTTKVTLMSHQLGFRVPTTFVRTRRGGKGSEGVRGSKGGEGKLYWVLGSPPPVSTKSSITTYSGQVSPPPANRTTTPCTFTKQQKAFVGPHHCTKISRQKQQTTKVTLMSHQLGFRVPTTFVGTRSEGGAR